jgi:dihydroflavonol-4-reductase
MKILVTGANGLLGAHVVRELLNKKFLVRVLVRPESNLRALEGLKIEVFKGQVTQKEDVKKAVEGCSYVIHAAARAAHKPTSLEAFSNINIDSARHVAEACKIEGVKRLVFISTANCFGNGSKLNPGTEKHPFLPWMKYSGYAYSKFLAQQLILEESRAGLIDAVVVNPTFIIGANDVKPGSSKIFSFILKKRIAFFPTGGKNFVDAGAVATGVVNAMEKGKNGECYLLAGENLSYRDFFRLTANIAGQRSFLIPVPCFFLKLLGYAGNFSEKVLKKPVQLTRVNARMLCMENYYTAKKAEYELNFPFVPVETAIRKTLQWFRNNQDIAM